MHKEISIPSNSPAEADAPGLGLPTGTRLRATLEATASTAVKTPIIAVVQYNYQKDGEIIVPAGSKALGHIEQADRSGYLSIRFDSLLMPDGSYRTPSFSNGYVERTSICLVAINALFFGACLANRGFSGFIGLSRGSRRSVCSAVVSRSVSKNGCQIAKPLIEN